MFLVALAPRVAHVLALEASPLAQALILDEQVHDEWAGRVAAGAPWSVERASGEPLPYFRAPLYVWWLGGLYRVFGGDPRPAARLAQALLGALACGVVYLLGRRLLGPRWGAAAGLAMALDWALVYYDGELLITSPIVLLDALLLLALARAAEARAARWWALAGLLLGLSAIARPDVLVFAPAAFAWALWLERREWRRALAAGAALTLGTLAPIAPVTARNWLVGGDRVLIASQGGVNFYIGNNPLSDGVTAVVPGTSPEWWAGYDQTHAMVAADLGRKPLESEVSRWFFARGLEFWRSEPLAALRLLAKKLRYLLNRQEWANNKCLYTVLREFTPTTGWLPVGFWIVGPLGLLGLALSLREARLFPLWAFAATYGLAISAFFVTARFRLPLLAPLILLGTYAVQWLGERLRARRFGSLAAALAALALLATFVNWIPQRGPFAAPIRNPAETLGSLGNRLADLGRVDEALHWLGRASEEARAELAAGGLSAGRKANLSVIHYSTIFRSALVLEGAGRLAEALAAYRRIVPLVPPAARPDLHQRMARIHDAQGEPAKAEEQRAKAAAARRALGP